MDLSTDASFGTLITNMLGNLKCHAEKKASYMGATI